MGKVYILAGHTPDPSKGNYDPGAVGNGLKEADVVNEFVTGVCAHLVDLGVPHATDNDADSLGQVLGKLELGEDDVLIDFHCNSAGNPQATGTEVIVPYRATQREMQLAQAVLDAITGITGLKSRGVKDETQTARKKLAVMREGGTNVLVELMFISNSDDVAKYQAKRPQIEYAVAVILKRFTEGV